MPSDIPTWKTVAAARIDEVLGTKGYFAQPYHSWERGLNENTNGLIRQYFPKQTDFGKITEEQVREVQDKLNDRPRKCLGWRSPGRCSQITPLSLHFRVGIATLFRFPVSKNGHAVGNTVSGRVGPMGWHPAGKFVRARGDFHMGGKNSGFRGVGDIPRSNRVL